LTQSYRIHGLLHAPVLSEARSATAAAVSNDFNVGGLAINDVSARRLGCDQLSRLKTTVENNPDAASNAVITIAIRLRYDYDPTTTYRARLLPFDAIRRKQKNEHVSFSS